MSWSSLLTFINFPYHNDQILSNQHMVLALLNVFAFSFSLSLQPLTKILHVNLFIHPLCLSKLFRAYPLILITPYLPLCQYNFSYDEPTKHLKHSISSTFSFLCFAIRDHNIIRTFKHTIFKFQKPQPFLLHNT